MVVVQDCTWAFVEARIADNCATVEVTVANNSLPPLPPLLPSPSPSPFRMSVAAKAASNLAVSAASVADASTLPAAGETTAGNWSAVAATIGNTGCSAATVRRTEMVLAASAARKSGLAGASNSDRVAESDTSSGVAATAASSWQGAFVATSAGRNSAAEEMAARTRWVAEAKAENNSQAVVVATDDCTQRAVEARTARTESAAAGTTASNSAVFEGRIVSRGSVAAAAEKLADN